MKWDVAELQQALRQTFPSARIDVHGTSLDGERALTLTMLVVDESQRGIGVGSKIMRALCAYADEHAALIILSPFTERGVRYKNRLVRWYKTFGFVENKGRRRDFRFRDTMYRQPR